MSHAIAPVAHAVPSAAVFTFVVCPDELTDGADVDAVFVIREVERRRRRDGGDYLRLQLGDRTGAVTCMVGGARGDRGARPRRRRRSGSPAATRSTPASAPRSTSAACAGPSPAASTRRAARRALPGRRPDGSRGAGAAGHDPAARTCERCSSGSWERTPSFGQDYRLAPAAKFYHQAYRHGLLEHSLGVAQAVSAISATFGGIDRDVAVTGALLHDIGKLEAYSARTPEHRADRPRPAARRDRPRLLPDPPRDRGDRGLPRGARRGPSGTSSSPTTGPSSTAARWCRAPARPRSCT